MEKEFLKSSESSVTLNITGGKIDSYRKQEETKTTVRVYKDGKIGIAGALGDADEAALTEKAEAALARGIPYQTQLDGALELHMEHGEEILPNHELIPAMQRFLDRVAEVCPRFAVSNKIQLAEESCEYRNSNGRNLSWKDRWLDVSLLFQNRGAGNLMDAFYDYSSRKFEEDKMVAQCKEVHDAFFTPADIEAGKWPIVMSGGQLFGQFTGSFVGETYISGASLVSGKLGQKIFSEKLTVASDGNPETHLGACFFDDEGVVTQPDFRPALIENGVLRRVITTKNSAAKYDLPLSGSASAGYDSAPSLGLNGIYLKPTAEKLADLVPEKAIYISMAGGGDTTPDGHFATPVQCAYLMERGKLVGKLPDLNISGDFFDLLGKDYVGAVNDESALGEQLCVVNMQVTK